MATLTAHYDLLLLPLISLIVVQVVVQLHIATHDGGGQATPADYYPTLQRHAWLRNFGIKKHEPSKAK